MEIPYMLACGIVWQRTSDPEAGWELVEALESPNPRLRSLAQTLLAENGEASLALLESAVEAGLVSTQAAGPCMAEILRSAQGRHPDVAGATRNARDVSLC